MMGKDVAATGGFAIMAFLSSKETLPFFGVGFTTLGMCVAGSLMAFAYASPVTSWWKLIGYSVGGVFAGVWGVLLLPAGLDWEWYFNAGPEVMEPPLGGVIALISRWLIPALLENLPALWSRVFNTGPKTGEKP